MTSLKAIVAGALLAVSLCLAVPLPASAQDAEIRQIALTETHVKGFISAQKDLAGIIEKIQAAGDKPDPKLQQELEQLAVKHGFKSFEELDLVAENITMVLAGLDPKTGEFVDPAEVIKEQIAEVEKDKSLAEADKKQMLEEMREALKVTPPIEHKGNIELVKKNQAAIEKALE